jgi:hypothetical protein
MLLSSLECLARLCSIAVAAILSGIGRSSELAISGKAFAWYEFDVTAYVLSERAAGRNVISLALRALLSALRSSPFAYFSMSTSRETCCGGMESRVSLSFIFSPRRR